MSRYLILSDKGGRGVGQFFTLAGGGWVWTPPLLADVICEEPLIHVVTVARSGNLD